MRFRLISAATLCAGLGALAVFRTATSATPEPDLFLSVRVHIVQSGTSNLQGDRSLQDNQLEQRFERINEAFAPTGIQWQLESVRPHRIHSSTAWNTAVRSGEVRDRGRAFSSIAEGANMLHPRGVDVFVVRDLSPVGLDGAYKCALASQQRRPAVFIGNETSKGTPMPHRKWAHELGHVLGLKHPDCEPELGNRLMMSGACSHAQRGRIYLSPEEVETMRTQAARGVPPGC